MATVSMSNSSNVGRLLLVVPGFPPLGICKNPLILPYRKEPSRDAWKRLSPCWRTQVPQPETDISSRTRHSPNNSTFVKVFSVYSSILCQNHHLFNLTHSLPYKLELCQRKKLLTGESHTSLRFGLLEAFLMGWTTYHSFGSKTCNPHTTLGQPFT